MEIDILNFHSFNQPQQQLCDKEKGIWRSSELDLVFLLEIFKGILNKIDCH